MKCGLPIVAVLLSLPAVAAAQAPPCLIATDPEFGLTAAKPIATGGGVFAGSARQRRYLSVLRGPGGEAVTIVGGVGSGPQEPGSKVIIDRYSVTYDGLQAPVTLFLNMYAFDTPQVPRGFTCSESPSAALGPPPPELETVATVLRAHAYDQGATRPLAPVAFADAAGTPRALMFDFFNLASARAQADAARGVAPPQELPPAMMIVAYPVECRGSPVGASSIDIVSPQNELAPRIPGIGMGPQLTGIVPNAPLPEGGVGALFMLPSLPGAGDIRIGFPEVPACPDLPREILMSFRPEPGRNVAVTQPSLPPGTSEPDPSVFLHAIVDVDGTFTRPVYMAGPRSLLEAASAAVRSWKAEPARINGEPVISVVTLRVEFR